MCYLGAMDDEPPSAETKDVTISFPIGLTELRAVMAWAKAHDITRSRAIRSLVRIGLATGQPPGDEPDRRTTRQRRGEEG